MRSQKRNENFGKATRRAALLLAAVLVLSPVVTAEAAQAELPPLPEFEDLPFLPEQNPAEGEEKSGNRTGQTFHIQMETLPDEIQEISLEEAVLSAQSADTAGTDAAAEAVEAAGTAETAAEATEAETAEATEAETAEATEPEMISAGTDAVCVHLAGEPGEPVPYRVMDTDTASLLKLVSEGLVTLDGDGDPAPGCAEKWNVSEDGLQWTFTLRDDLRWADGEPMEAEDFAELFRKIADPATEALYGADLMREIAGYEDVLKGDNTALDVGAEGDRKVVVRLSSPDPEFARKCASWALLPIREQIREDREDDVTADWMEITGNGPYYIASAEAGQEYLLKKNPWYQGRGTDADPEEGTGSGAPFEEVRWRVSGDSNEEYSDFLNGNIDAMAQIPAEEEADLDAGRTAVDYQVQVTPETLGIYFNCSREALQDPQVRKALAYALDREFIAENILDNVYAPATDPAMKDAGFEKAEKLLAQAGHKNGEGIPTLTCVVDENGGAFFVAEYLASAWKDLGVDVKVEKEDARDLAQEKTAGTYDILCGVVSLASDISDVELERYITSNDENVTGFSSKEYDRAMEDAEEETDDREYRSYIREAGKILAEELPVVPLVQRRVSWIRQAGESGIFCDASGCWQLWEQPALSAGQSRTTEDVPSEEEQEGTVRTASDYAGSAAAGNTGNAGSISGADTADARSRTVSDATDKLHARTWGAGDAAAEAESAGIDLQNESESADQAADTPLAQLRRSSSYYERTDTTGYLTRQAWVLESADPGTERLFSLPKYAEVHLVGTGNGRYVRIEQDGRFRYLDSSRVTDDTHKVDAVRSDEADERLQREILSASMHHARESELALRASDVRAETDRILEEIAHREMIRTQTRNPNWNGPVLSRRNGSITGPSGKETYYNLNMNGVVNIMRRMGNTDEYWVRDDGCKMLGDYIMCAANLRVHPRGTLVECSLGTCIVCDTGGFASRNANQLDIAVTW